jgi:hypothetical protein
MVLDTASRVSDEAKAEAETLDEPEPATPAAEAPEAPKRAETEAIPPEVSRLLRKVLPALWLAGVIAAGVISGVELAFLVVAAGVLTLVITLMWSSVQSLTGGTSLGFEEALGMGAPSKVEEEKRSVLRALKDLEYERSVGKISPEDYAELVAKYRAEAKRLMQSVDEKLGPARQQVEQQLAERLGSVGVSPPARSPATEPASAEPTPATEPEADSAPIPENTEGRASSQPAPPEEKS